ncbi:MAG TPA: hypothetical protein VFJ16_25790 [Longimicrobium sp.]|nr:hypothetical protein [Longimicrobium sp.]
MPTPNEITSREYKLLLSTTRFRKRGSVADEWLELVKRAVKRAGGTMLLQKELEEEQAKAKGEKPDDWHNDESGAWIEKERETSFLDTRDDSFRNLGWILRARREEGKVDLTLKFRCPDRLLAALKDASSTEKGKPKFEEDIVPPFASQYSRSNTLKNRDDGILPETVAEAAALFPALGTLGIIAQTPLETVGGLVVNEIARRVGGFRFGDGPILEMSHTFWYVGDTRDHFPMVAEFSFEFAPKDGEFPLETVKGGSEIYRELQAQAGWLDVAGTTKSSLVAGGV